MNSTHLEDNKCHVTSFVSLDMRRMRFSKVLLNKINVWMEKFPLSFKSNEVW